MEDMFPAKFADDLSTERGTRDPWTKDDHQRI
jgi:hypothetical protein